MSLISESRWRPEVEDVVEVLGLLLVQLAEHPLVQHLREADDRVERRAQLVRHVGQELGLVLVGRLELAVQAPELVAHAVQVGRQRAQLVAVRRPRPACAKSPAAICAKRASICCTAPISDHEMA